MMASSYSKQAKALVFNSFQGVLLKARNAGADAKAKA